MLLALNLTVTITILYVLLAVLFILFLVFSFTASDDPWIEADIAITIDECEVSPASLTSMANTDDDQKPDPGPDYDELHQGMFFP